MSQTKKLILIFSAILICLNLSFIALYFVILSPPKKNANEPTPISADPVKVEKPNQELSDEYYSIHFSFNDAIDLCLMQARSRNSNLIQLNLNEHSSRFKPEENLYLIEAKLPEKLITSYDKEIPFKSELQGTASIITAKKRISDRIFEKFRALSNSK